MITQLNLPHPSRELLRTIERISHTSTTESDEQKRAMNYLSKFVKNSSPGWFFPDPLGIETKFNDEYGSFFGDQYAYAEVAIFPNLSNSLYATLPAHIDRIRSTALNYIISPGGNNVITEVYHTPDHIKTTDKIQMGDYKNLTVETHVTTKINNWYVINVQKYHSVQNIETKRVVLSVAFKISYNDFLNKYKHLVSTIPL